MITEIVVTEILAGGVVVTILVGDVVVAIWVAAAVAMAVAMAAAVAMAMAVAESKVRQWAAAKWSGGVNQRTLLSLKSGEPPSNKAKRGR